MSRREALAWAAGLFEGEGCVFLREDRGSVAASLTMTDEDRVRLLYDTLGTGTVISVKPRYAHWKPSWKWSTCSFEGVQAVGAMLWPWLGPRRQAAFSEALKQARSRPHARQLRRTCTECGLTTSAGPMGYHQKQLGHEGFQEAA